MNHNLFPFVKIFSTIEEKKKERRKGKKSTNRLETTRRRTIHFSQLIMTNVIAICARGRGKWRGPRMDDSSIIPPDANGVDVPEIAGILRLNSRHQMNPPPPALHQRSRSRASLRAKRTTREPSREKPAETRGTFAAYRVSNLQLEPPKIPPRLYNRDSAIPNFPLSSRASKPTCAINRSRVPARITRVTRSVVVSRLRGRDEKGKERRRKDQGPASVELGRESGYKLIQKSAGEVLKTRRKVVKPCIFHRPVN